MLQKMTQAQLQSSKMEELQVCRKEAAKRKTELEALKKSGGRAWNSTLQSELDDVTLYIVDIEDVMEEKQAENKSTQAIKPGTEKLVQLSIIRGRRFNPMTGKEESEPYVQMFTYSEWQLFKKHFKSLGYTIMEVINDPYGDAKSLAAKLDK